MKKKYSLIALMILIIILLSIIIGLLAQVITMFSRIPSFTYPTGSIHTSQYCSNQPVLYNSSNVVGYWKLNENSGINASDSSGNENHGIVSYDNWTVGKLNNSLSYNGINQSINCGNVEYSGDFTIEFWTYIRDNVSRLCFIDDYYNTPAQGILVLRLFSVVAFYVFDSSSGYNLVYHTALGINTHQWYHIAYAFDIDNYSASTPYINAVPSKYGEYIVGNVANYSNHVNFTIGYSSLLSFYTPIDGYMDNVILYNRTLTHKEVLSQYNKGAGYEGYPDGYDPIIENITEYSDPSEYGYNINITVDVCDYSGIDFVYLDDGNVNYTMANIGGNTYSYATWIPSYAGYRNYKIWCKDMRTNTIYQQGSVFVIDSTETVLSLIVLFLFLILQLILYLRLKPHREIKFPLIAGIFLFALIINVASIGNRIPFTPYLQFFFIIFEIIVFIMTSIEYYKKKKVDKF